MQFVITYWSQVLELVTAQHLETYFIGHARADDIVLKHNKALDGAGLAREKELKLGKDGLWGYALSKPATLLLRLLR